MIGRDLLDSSQNNALTPLLQLFVCLRFFATGAFHKLIGDSIHISECTFGRYCKSVTDLSYPPPKIFQKSRFKFYNFFYQNNFSLGRPVSPPFSLCCRNHIVYVLLSHIRKKKLQHRRQRINGVESLRKKSTKTRQISQLKLECKFSA